MDVLNERLDQNQELGGVLDLPFALQIVGDDGERSAAFSQTTRAAEAHSERPDGGPSHCAALRSESVQVKTTGHPHACAVKKGLNTLAQSFL